MKNLKQLLKTYIQRNPNEVNAIKMLNFFDNHDGCFEKDNLPGHFTGSAWVISPDKNKILLEEYNNIIKLIREDSLPERRSNTFNNYLYNDTNKIKCNKISCGE